MQETWVLSLGWEDLEEEMATNSSILARRIPMDRGDWWATVHGATKSQIGLSDTAEHRTFICSTPLGPPSHPISPLQVVVVINLSFGNFEFASFSLFILVNKTMSCKYAIECVLLRICKNKSLAYQNYPCNICKLFLKQKLSI